MRPMYHNNLGLALENKGEHDAAIAAYRKAIRLKPDEADYHNDLGVALEKQGRARRGDRGLP